MSKRLAKMKVRKYEMKAFDKTNKDQCQQNRENLRGSNPKKRRNPEPKLASDSHGTSERTSENAPENLILMSELSPALSIQASESETTIQNNKSTTEYSSQILECNESIPYRSLLQPNEIHLSPPQFDSLVPLFSR